MSQSISVYSLPRNSVEACRSFYAARKRDRGGITPDEMRTMLHLQDDTEELSAVVAEEKWIVIR